MQGVFSIERFMSSLFTKWYQCFFPVAAVVAASAMVFVGVGVYPFQRNCTHCTQRHRQCTMLTLFQARASYIK
jgi:hypothetical protein